ncbi:MAG: 2-C-methyl-D-erythritol 4-phosphate cytidylyltransferase [Rickettsiales bacterium]
MVKLRNKNIAALIVAGGTGSRLGGDTPKQYLKINNKPIISYTVDKFRNHPGINHVCVAISKEKKQTFTEIFKDTVDFCFGGNERKDSVRLGLEYLTKINPDFVLIHDAARPLINEEDITQIIEKLDGGCGVVAAKKINDTVKKVNGQNILHTISRKSLMAAETPQAFDFNKIFLLHQEHKHLHFTDDSMLFEMEGLPVKFIETTSNNIKITSKEDLLIAESIIRQNEN